MRVPLQPLEGKVLYKNAPRNNRETRGRSTAQPRFEKQCEANPPPSVDNFRHSDGLTCTERLKVIGNVMTKAGIGDEGGPLLYSPPVTDPPRSLWTGSAG